MGGRGPEGLVAGAQGEGSTDVPGPACLPSSTSGTEHSGGGPRSSQGMGPCGGVQGGLGMVVGLVVSWQ